jgi:hypothetical protein
MESLVGERESAEQEASTANSQPLQLRWQRFGDHDRWLAEVHHTADRIGAFGYVGSLAPSPTVM